MKVDDRLAQIILNNFDFSDFNPNNLTLLGIIINFILYYLLVFKNGDSKPFVCMLLLIRYLIDILDGNIARKYQKTSKLGGYLDSFSDLMLSIILNLYLAQVYHLKISIPVMLIILHVTFFQYYNAWNIHQNHHQPKIVKFLLNNTFIFYLVFLVFLK